jgi:restriction endonuclease Mrr
MEYYQLSSQEQLKKIQSSPVDKQLVLYECDMLQEPPADISDILIAQHGAELIPVVLEKMKATKDEGSQEILIHILEEMAKKGYLRGRQDVADQVRATISAMKLAIIKREAQEKLSTIESNL